jgi:hypothetical protein
VSGPWCITFEWSMATPGALTSSSIIEQMESRV